MATTPDLSTLTSSAQIFTSGTYTLPQIRNIHKQLNDAIDDKSARLRTQVGSSYRELLGTADKIVKMRTDMDRLHSLLEGMGAKCGRSVVSGKAQGLNTFLGSTKEQEEDGESYVVGLPGRDGPRARNAAMLKLLDGCILALRKLVRSHENSEGVSRATGAENDLLTAAKVFVLGRLLIDSLERRSRSMDIDDERTGAAAQTSKATLAKLKRALVRRIDKEVGSVRADDKRNQLISVLCAYSLLQSAGAQDTTRHFLRVRGEAIAAVFNHGVHAHGDEQNVKYVVEGLKLYTQTLLDVQYMVPTRLSNALGHVEKVALLDDPSLRHIETLRLDVLGKWCAERVQEYKPRLQHDDLDGSTARDLLFSWAERGIKVLLKGLGEMLSRTTDFSTVVEMRTHILRVWIRDGGHARGFDPSIMLGQLRDTINDHIKKMLSSSVGKLKLIGAEMDATLGNWPTNRQKTAKGLWQHESLETGLPNGADHFAQQVISRLYGRDEATSRTINGFKSWLLVIAHEEELLQQLKKQRWDNDVDEIEAEETIEQRQQQLSRDDPDNLLLHLRSTIQTAFSGFDSHLTQSWQFQQEKSGSAEVAQYFLRVLRDIRARLPQAVESRSIGDGIMPQLHQQIARTVMGSAVDEFTVQYLSQQAPDRRPIKSKTGPDVPMSPSLTVVRLLRGLTRAMDDAGPDLWSPIAVEVLQSQVGQAISNLWTDSIKRSETERDKPSARVAITSASDDGVENGEQEDDSEHVQEEQENDSDTAKTDNVSDTRAQQRYLDSLVLHHFLGDHITTELRTVLAESVNDPTQQMSIATAAETFFNKSSLLFGLLVVK